MTSTRTCLALFALLAGCGEEQPANLGTPKATPQVTTEAEYPPAVCKAWGAAIERMNKCPGVSDLMRSTFGDQYESAAPFLSGEEPRDPTLLAQMCAQNLKNVESAMESVCAPERPRTPVEEHGFLEREIARTTAAIEIKRGMGASGAELETLEREKQELTRRFEALDAELARERNKGTRVSDHCKKYPLAKDCM